MAALPSLPCRAEPPAPFKGIDITGATYARDFSLPDAEGAMRSLGEFKGKVVLVFFGFAQCPDVCPTTLGRAIEVRKLLGADGNEVQVVLITVDPERDKPEVLREYMKAYDPSFIALRPEPDELKDVAAGFKIYYKKVSGSTPTSYTMDHSATIVVLNPQGNEVGIIRPPFVPEKIAADMLALSK